MSTQEEVKDVRDKLHAIFKLSATEEMGYIVYVFDASGKGGGTGFNSKNCDIGDVIVAIERIAKQFGIDLRALAEIIEKGET